MASLTLTRKSIVRVRSGKFAQPVASAVPGERLHPVADQLTRPGAVCALFHWVLVDRHQVGGQLRLQILRVLEPDLLGELLDEEVERVDHLHVGDQADGDLQGVRAFGEHQAGQEVAERVLLPVDEVLRRLHRQGIRLDLGPRVHCGPQPHDVRIHLDEAVERIRGAVLERHLDAHREITPQRTAWRTARPASRWYHRGKRSRKDGGRDGERLRRADRLLLGNLDCARRRRHRLHRRRVLRPRPGAPPPRRRLRRRGRRVRLPRLGVPPHGIAHIGRPARQCPTEREFVGELQVTAHRQTGRQAGDGQTREVAQHPHQIRRGGLALGVRVGRDDHLGDVDAVSSGCRSG